MSKWVKFRPIGAISGMSALPPKADITERGRHVRFVPTADIEPALATVSSMSELPKIAVVVSVASFLAVSPSALHAQSECNTRQILQPGNCIGDDLDALEIELAKQINDYRLQNGLKADIETQSRKVRFVCQ